MLTLKLGPCGGAGGHAWEVTGIQKLQKIKIYWAEHAIIGFTFKYIDRNGTQQTIDKKGNWSYKCSQEISFEDEVLTSIEGTCGQTSGYTVVTSLTIYTSKNKYGPYGQCGNGVKFYIPAMEKTANVVGFHGHCGGMLDSIGITLLQYNSGGVGGQSPQGTSGGPGTGGSGGRCP